MTQAGDGKHSGRAEEPMAWLTKREPLGADGNGGESATPWDSLGLPWRAGEENRCDARRHDTAPLNHVSGMWAKVREGVRALNGQE